MRRLIWAAILALTLAAPVSSHAQVKAAPPQPRSTEIFGLTKEQVFVVGAGVVVGALLVHVLIGADFTYFAGAVAGGLVADWWYEHGGKSQVPKLMKRLGDAAPGAVRPIPLAAGGR